MKKKIILSLMLCFLIFSLVHSVNAISETPFGVFGNIFGNLNWEPDALSSNSEVIGNYEVILSTNPYTPYVNQTTNIQFKVFNYNQGPNSDRSNYASIGVNHFVMGVRIYHNDKLVGEISPTLHKGSSWDTNFVFHESGNHVFKIDLYNLDQDTAKLTYVFNVSVLTEYGPIFVYITIAAAIVFTIIILWMKFIMKKKKSLPN